MDEAMIWQLEEELECAKANPFRVHTDFDTRMDAWVTQIIPGRFEQQRQSLNKSEFAHRMVELTALDAERLQHRALKELGASGCETTYMIRIEDVLTSLVTAIKVYENGGDLNAITND